MFFATFAVSGFSSMSTNAISLPRIARHNPLAAAGLVLVIVFVLCAIFAPWIAPRDPPRSISHAAGPAEPFPLVRTDELGRDICSRLIYGARISMLVGSSVVGLSLGIGLIIGSIAGYYGGGIDRL